MKENQNVTFEEIAYSNMLSIEAIVNLLIRKEMLTQEEIIEEIQLLKHKEHSEPN